MEREYCASRRYYLSKEVAQTEFEFFRDVFYETNQKPEEIRRREEESLEIFPRQEIPIPLPHELLDERIRRPFPHELLGLQVLAER